MGKTLVVDTSTGGLDYYPFQHDIEILRIKIYLNDKSYLDGLDLKADEFYEMLRKDPELVPKTSQPSIGEVMAFFESFYNQGYDTFYVTTISSLLSGTYNAICLAKDELKDKMKIRVFDTHTVCFSEGLFALEASKLIKEGKSFDEVDERLDLIKQNNTIFFAVDSLSYLVKNGRLSGAAAFVGKLFKIKPILQVQSTGQIVSIEKIRNIKIALTSIVDKILAYANGRPFDAYILYTGNPRLKEHFKEIIKTTLKLENLYEAPQTPVVGAHIGPDVVGIGIMLKI